ncbi:MAG: YHYH protein [Flavobacteriales bacterium]
MNRIPFLLASLAVSLTVQSQTNPAIVHWIQNPQGTTGAHYVAGNPTPIQDNVPVNVQMVQYSDSWVYVNTNGIPAYITGPCQDGNPSQASDQNAIYKISLNPIANSGTPSPTTGGNIGIFINGVSLFDYRDGVSWNNQSQSEGGGPIMGPPGQGVWNRDAIVAERLGFDCAKGHPAMGNYHHHQNPSAFDMDLVQISDVCDVYAADGLYVIDASVHSPWIGFAYDGFPIYGAYGFANADGSGGVTRMKSSYQLRNITVRNTYADGSSVTPGPPVNDTYPLGRYREDYEFVAHPEPDFLDEHNGRFCMTPEYPQGVYAYFCTVDENWNSAYPYVVGPTFYGVKTGAKVQNIAESVTTYSGIPNAIMEQRLDQTFTVFPNPATEFVAAQLKGLNSVEWKVELFDVSGKLLQTTRLFPGSTMAYFDTQSLYAGEYVMVFTHGEMKLTRRVSVVR